MNTIGITLLEIDHYKTILISYKESIKVLFKDDFIIISDRETVLFMCLKKDFVSFYVDTNEINVEPVDMGFEQ